MLIHMMALMGLPGEMGPRRRVFEEGPQLETELCAMWMEFRSVALVWCG